MHYFFLKPIQEACGILVPKEELDRDPQQWECNIQITGPPGNPQESAHLKKNIMHQKDELWANCELTVLP